MKCLDCIHCKTKLITRIEEAIVTMPKISVSILQYFLIGEPMRIYWCELGKWGPTEKDYVVKAQKACRRFG